MALNFNVDPYYDDFDPSKNFHRILFKPGFAVQARELTQSQTIIQDQISKFASNIFTQNTPVTGGKVTTNLNCSYIKLNATYLGATILASSFLNQIITDATGTVKAKVLATSEATGTSTNPGDPPTLIVTYFSGITFSDGQTVYTSTGNYTATTIGVPGGTISVGSSSIASIADGVFYVVNGYSVSSVQNSDGTYTKYSIGNFVSVQPQTVILSKYGVPPNARIGLSITETIIDSINDSSLLDPAIGASNYQAPGSDRYQINLTLITLPLTLGNDDQFIELLRIENGAIVKQVDGTVYSVIDDYFAKRDYETNGDYVVNDFKITPSPNGSSDYYNLTVGKGIAYVHGYRIESQQDTTILNDRARQTSEVIGNDVYVDYGGYFYVDTLNGLFDVTTLPAVDLHCVPAANVNSANAATYTSTLVGSGISRNLIYVTDSGTANSYVFKSYVSDVTASSLSGNATSSSTATTIQFYDTTSKFSTTANAYIGVTITITSGTSQGDTRKILSYNASTKIATVDLPFTKTPDTTTNFLLLFGTTVVESVVQRTSNSVYTLKTTSNINTQSGKINALVNNDTIYNNTGTSPELVFDVGGLNVSGLANTSYSSTKVFRNKTFTNLGGASSLTISMPTGSSFRFSGSGTLGASAIKNLFTVIDTSTGSIIDFTTGGATVSISGSTSATFTGAAAAGKTVNIIVNSVNIINADTTNYVLKSKNLLTGNTNLVSISGPDAIINSNTYIDLTKGQVYIKNVAINASKLSLYVADVKSIVKIIDTQDPAVVPTVAMLNNPLYDITNYFAFDNGQRDTYYDHAGITLVAGANKPRGNILVVFNYYKHTGGDGYFSVNSYLGVSSGGVSTSPEQYAQIPTYTSSHGTVYNLVDSIDFRASRKNAQTSLVFEYTGNPASDDTGILIPTDLSNFLSNYFYYLGRKDKLVLTKDKNFQIIQGSPAINPILPVEPDGSLVLAELIHDPYTAYIPGENPVNIAPNLSINKIKHRRWTMEDITGLETRIENLEYYTALNLLEQNALNLQVPDANGLNRFKNGILVDDFSSYSTAATSDPNFNANINIRKKQLKPLTDVQNFQLQNPIVLTSLGSVSKINNYQINTINAKQTNIYTLPYTTTSIITQPLASNILSVNPFSVINQQGILQLNPPMDNWIDTSYNPSILTNSPSYQIYQATNSGLNVINAGDFASVIGTPVTSQTSVSQSGITNQTSSTALTVNNGYVINNAILPYIRPQQVIVRSKGMLINTPVNAWFDGKNVNTYMTSPNTVELTNVSGTFNEDDVVGFYYLNKFHYLGTVVSVYRYPGTNNVRLYVATIQGLSYAPAGTPLQNAMFDSNGLYSSNTAAGMVNGSVQNIHLSGTVSGVGGAYAANNISGTSLIYRVTNPNNWGTFLNQYGVWGDLQHDGSGNATNPYAASFSVNFATTGTYTFYSSSNGPATTSLDGSTVMTTSSSTTTSTATPTVTAGNHTVAVSATNSSGPAGYALVIKDAAGNIIFDITNPTQVTYNYVASNYTMSSGGYWFTGVQKVKLDPNSSSVNNYYAGSQINITSTYVLEQTSQTATYIAPQPKQWCAPQPISPQPIYDTITTTVAVPVTTGYTVQNFVRDPTVFNPTNVATWLNASGTPIIQSVVDTIDNAYASGAATAAAEAVRAAYVNQLGRLPETGGAGYWTTQILAGNLTTATVAAAILAAGQGDGESNIGGTLPPDQAAKVGQFLDVADTTRVTYQSSTQTVITGYTP